MTRQGRARVEIRYTLWAKHAYGPKNWLPLYSGATQEWAVGEMVIRQDRVRRSGEPCRFKVTPDGEKPSE